MSVKSFSSTSFASDQPEVLDWALAAVKKDPQALFTNFQWFLYEGKDTVFYTAFSKNTFDDDGLANMVAEMVALAPQLTHGFVGAQPGQPFPKHMLDAITSVETVDSFEGYPDKWLGKSDDIFARKDLPLFRVMVANRRGGPDEKGRASILQVRSAHALMEGSDSALLTRSQHAGHGVMSDRGNRIDWKARAKSTFAGWLMLWTSILFAAILAPKEMPWGFSTLAITRQRLRALANRLGVRQRSLYFALVTFALNGKGKRKDMSETVIAAAYTMLDTKRNNTDDDFFRVRALQAKFPVKGDFIDYVRSVDDTVGKIEQTDITKFQVMINAMFAAMRKLNRLAPFLPGKRYWRFNGGMHIVLTLVPPHRTYGSMTNGVMEPIYCGAWHSASNIVTFCPGREYVTFNFSMEQRHLANVPRITALLKELEAMDIPAHTRRPREDAEA